MAHSPYLYLTVKSIETKVSKGPSRIYQISIKADSQLPRAQQSVLFCLCLWRGWFSGLNFPRGRFLPWFCSRISLAQVKSLPLNFYTFQFRFLILSNYSFPQQSPSGGLISADDLQASFWPFYFSVYLALPINQLFFNCFSPFLPCHMDRARAVTEQCNK